MIAVFSAPLGAGEEPRFARVIKDCAGLQFEGSVEERRSLYRVCGPLKRFTDPLSFYRV